MNTRITPIFAALVIESHRRAAAAAAATSERRVFYRDAATRPTFGAPNIVHTVTRERAARAATLATMREHKLGIDTSPLAPDTDATRIILRRHHRRGPILSETTLCAACARVALRSSEMTLLANGRVFHSRRRILSMRVIESGSPCACCGRADLPYATHYAYGRPLFAVMRYS